LSANTTLNNKSTLGVKRVHLPPNVYTYTYNVYLYTFTMYRYVLLHIYIYIFTHAFIKTNREYFLCGQGWVKTAPSCWRLLSTATFFKYIVRYIVLNYLGTTFFFFFFWKINLSTNPLSRTIFERWKRTYNIAIIFLKIERPANLPKNTHLITYFQNLLFIILREKSRILNNTCTNRGGVTVFLIFEVAVSWI